MEINNFLYETFFHQLRGAKRMKLTDRQIKTLELIKANSLKGIETTQREIYENQPTEYVWNDDPYIHDHCSSIWRDIEAINTSDEVDEIIVIKNNTYKFAESCAEANAAAQKYLDKAVITFKRYWRVMKKIKQDGQGKIFEPDEFYDTYLKGKLYESDNH